MKNFKHSIKNYLISILWPKKPETKTEASPKPTQASPTSSNEKPEKKKQFYSNDTLYNNEIRSSAPIRTSKKRKQILKPFFVIVAEKEGSTLEFDSISKIAKLKWNGTVSVKAASYLVTMGATAVEVNGYRKLILDRSNLIEFDTEARIWIKNMLRTRARKLAGRVEKLAIINSSHAKGSVFSNMISSAISLIMPNLTLKKFDDLSDAINWIAKTNVSVNLN